MDGEGKVDSVDRSLQQISENPDASVTMEGKGDDDSNLIVNYLPPSMTEEGLTNLFQPHGTILQAKVVRNRITGSSAGYGFVKFASAASAQQAIQFLNGCAIENKRIKVSIAKPQPQHEPISNLYISGMPLTWNKEELARLVSQYGKVTECRVLLDMQTKQPKGVGFARLDTQEHAIQAIAALNGQMVQGSKLKLVVKFADQVSNFTPSKKRPLGMGYGLGPMAMAHVDAMRGFSSNNYFPFPGQQSGMSGMPPNSMMPGMGGMSGQPQQGMGQGQPHGGMDVSQPGNMGLQPTQQYPGICLFIYHLPPTASEHDLYRLFSQYGAVYSAKVMKDLSTGLNKGFGFVNMMTPEQAAAAIAGLTGYKMGNKYLKVSYKK